MKYIAIILALSFAAMAQQPKEQSKSIPTLSVKTGAGGVLCTRPGCGVGDNNWMAMKELQAINNRFSDAVQVTDSDKADYRLMSSFGLIHNSAMLFDKDGKLVHEFKTGGRMSKAVCQYFEDKKKESK